MKIVAFLQNLWVKEDVAAVHARFAKNGEAYRRRFIQRCLFAGCLTGRRLTQTFGHELLGGMLFEESTREISGDSRSSFPPNLGHIRAVLEELQPRVVVAFGKIATLAVKQVWDGPLVIAPHPASLHVSAVGNLDLAARRLREMLAAFDAEDFGGVTGMAEEEMGKPQAAFGPTVANPAVGTCASATGTEFNAEGAEAQRAQR